MTARILVADDERVLRENLCEFLSQKGFEVSAAADGEAALQLAMAEDFAVIVSDIRMPKLDGVALLKRVMAERPDTSVLLITAYATVDTAIEALRYGAHDYLLKPIAFEDLLKKVENVIRYRALQGEVQRLRKNLHERLGFEGIVGQSESIQRVFELVDKVAPTPSTVLITGESGTGKELVARAIWAHSKHSDREFLAVNMAALPGELVEAQLFGHEKGAFTGADRRREGSLRSVHGGTIFLDEIAELPMSAQAKLLRALENGEVLPVGSDRPQRAEFRLVAATNQDLEEAVRDGRFRQDLFFRLDVFRIPLPPLRERRDDIPELVAHFCRHHAQAIGRRPCAPSNEAMRLLMAYPWPGNVRELSNVLERATILASGNTIEPEDLPAGVLGDSQDDTPMALRSAVEGFERRHIAWVLRAAGGNKERAARMLEVDPATLYRRISKYDLG